MLPSPRYTPHLEMVVRQVAGATTTTLEGTAVSRFTAAQRWAAILVFLVVGYTVVAHLAWSRVSADLKDVTDRIRSGTTVGAR